MNPTAIAKMRRTFIAIAMASFLVVIAFMGTAAAIANILAVTDNANRTIDAILDAGGEIPSESNFPSGAYHEEAVFGLRFFTVTFDQADEPIEVNLSHIASVDREQAIEVATNAPDAATIVGIGRYENYLYKEGKTKVASDSVGEAGAANAANASDGVTMAVFLDCSFELANANAAIMNTILVCVVALIVTFISVFFFSKRAIRTEIENAQRQQRFMTNASHELKTPIAVIRANTELTEMISGETEWTQSTLRQVDRLERLVRDLMTIVRGVEQGSQDTVIENVDASEVVSQAVESFRAVAQQNGLGLTSGIAPGVTLRCNPKSIEQLTCLLVDNAMKYCDEGGNVLVSFAPARLGHGCTLIVSNDYAAGGDVDYRRFFDRFYREDESHENQQGYGIGLSVAESICKHYHGSIKASWRAGIISFTCSLKDV